MSTKSETRYIWRTIGKIAKYCQESPNDVYERFVREVSPPEVIEIAKNHEEEVLGQWNTGIGTKAQVVERLDNNYVRIQIKKGISWFNYEQTRQLIWSLEKFAWENKIPLD